MANGSEGVLKVSESTLSEFLLARIADDEADARDQWGRSWSSGYGASVWGSEEVKGGYGYPLVAECPDGAGMHIARHDPSRVLAECEAKRDIVAAMMGEEFTREEYAGAKWMHEQALRILAAAYADHPDYREEWRP